MSLPKPYYDHDGITIYHGDCREILPELPMVDLVLTDPPYGIRMDKGFGGYGKHQDKQRGHSRRHAGFNDRWDAMSKQEQCAGFRNKRDVWFLATEQFKDAHFTVFPESLVEPCIRAGSKEGDLILDPFCGSGTTGVVALKLGRSFLGIDLNPSYVEMAKKRIGNVMPLFEPAHA